MLFDPVLAGYSRGEILMQPGDVTLLDCLRKAVSLSVAELQQLMGVTATAVRQRLTRLMDLELIERTSFPAGRGRPSFRYRLTEKGRRETGSNFADLALALWAEIRAIKDPEVRRGLMQRLSTRLASLYADRVQGDDLRQRMESVVALLGSRNVPFQVEMRDQLPVLTALGCPYTELADKDSSICALERMLFTELLGEKLNLSTCRLDGSHCCTFEVATRQTT